ncbi:hypothetical protein QL919_07590 [Psychrobacter sp. APC 3426]|uniref:hypothetical protein n=1 Tax=Psychrobacter sp. APC 3426 TaxID=3035177 RepID=UPI0025B2C62B|nr:hypothetical protein [Psychrobacter sp. APC 3426]MDN3398584.1 hypothetical protein [Psychrobacter sp. APC 3426]
MNLLSLLDKKWTVRHTLYTIDTDDKITLNGQGAIFKVIRITYRMLNKRLS